MNNIIKINSPCDEKIISKLKIGDIVSISGKIITARDAVHKFLYEKYVIKKEKDELFFKLKEIMNKSILFHCGPIISTENNEYVFLAGGPTTSIREEPYQAFIIKLFNLKAIIGKGGMGDKTLKGLKENNAVYFHTTGGCAVFIGECVREILDVFFLKDFGIPEAMWVLEVIDLPAIVTMDSKGNSLHKKVYDETKANFNKLLDNL